MGDQLGPNDAMPGSDVSTVLVPSSDALLLLVASLLLVVRPGATREKSNHVQQPQHADDSQCFLHNQDVEGSPEQLECNTCFQQHSS